MAYLKYERVALTSESAKVRIQDMLSDLYPSSKHINFLDFTDYVLPGISFTIEEEIKELLKNGKANKLQMLYDQNDALFGSLPSIGVVSDIQGISVEISSSFLGQNKKIKANGFIEKPEDSLSNDICVFKDIFYQSFLDKSYDDCFRAYRSFLFSSITLVDLYMNRFVTYARNKELPEIKTKEFEILDSQKNMDDRLNSWIKLFSNEKESIKGNKEWNAFIKIKKARNDFVHPKSIGFGYEFKNIIDIFNCSVDGIGGLLYKMHKASERNGYLGFIQQLMNQGNIVYN